MPQNKSKHISEAEALNLLIRGVDWLIRRQEKVEDKLNRLVERQMANKDEILAEIRTNTSIAESSAQAIDLLREGNDNIQAKIDDLKTQIEAGNVPTDLSEIDAALDEQRTVLEKVKTEIGANTSTPTE